LRFKSKRLTNTPVPRRRFVLKFPDERRTEGFSTQTTYTRGSSGRGGGIHEQRYATERVLPQSAVKLRHAESAPEEATLEEKKRRAASSASRLVPVELAARKSPMQSGAGLTLDPVLSTHRLAVKDEEFE
jgi:hypothetical protein